MTIESFIVPTITAIVGATGSWFTFKAKVEQSGRDIIDIRTDIAKVREEVTASAKSTGDKVDRLIFHLLNGKEE